MSDANSDQATGMPSSVNHGHFLDPFAPIQSESAAKGRVRLAAVLTYVCWIGIIVSSIMLGGQAGEGPDGPVVPAWVQAISMPILALIVIMPLAATISIFVQTLYTTGFLAITLFAWVVVRLIIYANIDAFPTGIAIVGLAISVALTVVGALALVHAIRSQATLNRMARQG